MNIQEEREYILSENNTAQQQVNDLLTTLTPSSTVELNIEDALSGNIDFSVLNSLGFTKIKTIHLGKGKITGIIHIPNQVTVFNCADNILTTLSLPKSILELNCANNHISHIGFDGIHSLVKINCSHNELTELAHIPDSIQEIDCDNNHITHLDLNGLTLLKVLHCSNNKLMIIQNLPAKLDDLKMDNNPMAEIEHTATTKTNKKAIEKSTEIKIDFMEALREYFRLKAKYEKKMHDLKKTAFQSTTNKRIGKLRAASVKPQCVNCNRKVGSIFFKKDDKLVALCGDKDNPCNLNIQLYSGIFFNYENALTSHKSILYDTKDAIITQKLDTIFNYLSESQSSVLFKKELDNYNETSIAYKEIFDDYEKTYNNMHKRELIQRKNSEIYELVETIHTMMNEYTKTNNTEILKTAVQMQMEELIPKIEFLRRLKYDIMEMVEDKNEQYHLVQREVPLSKIDFTYSEPSHVIKYVK